MDPKNLETAARFAKKRKELSEMHKLLCDCLNTAEVKVVVNESGGQRESGLQSDTFNALLCKLLESEIQNIDNFVANL